MTVPQWAVTAAGSTKRPASIPSTTAMTMRKVRELSALPLWWASSSRAASLPRGRP